MHALTSCRLEAIASAHLANRFQTSLSNARTIETTTQTTRARASSWLAGGHFSDFLVGLARVFKSLEAAEQHFGLED